VNQPASKSAEALSLDWIVMSDGNVFSKVPGIPGTPFFYKSGTTNMQIGAVLNGAEATLAPAVIEVSAPADTPTAQPAGSS